MRFINILILIILSSNSFAKNDFDFKSNKITPALRDAYITLNEKYGLCSAQERRTLTPIKSKWLASLSELQRKVVLSAISQKAFNRCIQAEDASFNDLLVKYTIETQNLNAIKTWIKLNKPYKAEDTQAILNALDQNEIEKLSHYSELYAPFNPIQAASVVTK